MRILVISLLFLWTIAIDAHKVKIKCSVLYNGLLLNSQENKTSVPKCVSSSMGELKFLKCGTPGASQKWKVIKMNDHFGLSIYDKQNQSTLCLNMDKTHGAYLGSCNVTAKTSLYHLQPLLLRSLAGGSMLGGYCTTVEKHNAQTYDVHNHFKDCCLHFELDDGSVSDQLTVVWRSSSTGTTDTFFADDRNKMIYIGSNFTAISENEQMYLHNAENKTEVLNTSFCQPQLAKNTNFTIKCLKFFHNKDNLPPVPGSAGAHFASVFAFILLPITFFLNF